MKATHQGHCQVCNRVQNIQGRNDMLAKHGYEVAGYGFFNGVCPGSEHLPLEQDKQMVEWSIDWANSIVARFVKERDAESKPITDISSMWFNEFIPGKVRGIPSRYVWNRVRIIEETKHYSDGTPYQDRHYIGHDGRLEPFMRYSLYGSLDEIVNSQRDKYIEQHIDARIKELRQYIQRQKERIKTWHQQPLIEIKAKL